MGSVLALLISAAVLAGPGAPSATHGARLQILDTSVTTIRGSGFKPLEHVRLVVRAGADSTTKRTVASGGGSFRLRLAGFDSSACAGFSVVATGSKGSRATFKRPPGECAVP